MSLAKPATYWSYVTGKRQCFWSTPILARSKAGQLLGLSLADPLRDDH
jgi:hypothetical protein